MRLRLRAPETIFELAIQYAFSGFAALSPLLVAALFWKGSTKWGALAVTGMDRDGGGCGGYLSARDTGARSWSSNSCLVVGGYGGHFTNSGRHGGLRIHAGCADGDRLGTLDDCCLYGHCKPKASTVAKYFVD